MVNEKSLYVGIGLAVSIGLAIFTFMGIIGSSGMIKANTLSSSGGSLAGGERKQDESDATATATADRIGGIEGVGEQYNAMVVECDKTFGNNSQAHDKCYEDSAEWRSTHLEKVVEKYGSNHTIEYPATGIDNGTLSAINQSNYNSNGYGARN